jgi:hypothetical protein
MRLSWCPWIAACRERRPRVRARFYQGASSDAPSLWTFDLSVCRISVNYTSPAHGTLLYIGKTRSLRPTHDASSRGTPNAEAAARWVRATVWAGSTLDTFARWRASARLYPAMRNALGRIGPDRVVSIAAFAGDKGVDTLKLRHCLSRIVSAAVPACEASSPAASFVRRSSSCERHCGGAIIPSPWTHSSARLEHLPHMQGVPGSSPGASTKQTSTAATLFDRLV